MAMQNQHGEDLIEHFCDDCMVTFYELKTSHRRDDKHNCIAHLNERITELEWKVESQE